MAKILGTRITLAETMASKGQRPIRRSLRSANDRSATFWRFCFFPKVYRCCWRGDECRRTQQGNNNPYLQDNEISWFDWTLVNTHAHLVDFTRWMIEFRKRHPALRREEFFRGVLSQRGLLDIAWRGCNSNSPGFEDPNSGVSRVHHSGSWGRRGLTRDSEHGRFCAGFSASTCRGAENGIAPSTQFFRHQTCSLLLETKRLLTPRLISLVQNRWPFSCPNQYSCKKSRHESGLWRAADRPL